jgi:hypothetical protein
VGLTRTSLAAQAWRREGVTEDNKLSTTWEEMKVFPIPAAIYLVKNLMQYVIFLYVDAPSYQILKNLNIITTGVLYRVFLKKHLTPVQWSALILLALGCTIAQTTSQSEQVRGTNYVNQLKLNQRVMSNARLLLKSIVEFAKRSTTTASTGFPLLKYYHPHYRTGRPPKLRILAFSPWLTRENAVASTRDSLGLLWGSRRRAATTRHRWRFDLRSSSSHKQLR